MKYQGLLKILYNLPSAAVINRTINFKMGLEKTCLPG